MGRNDILSLVIEPVHLAPVLESIASAAKAWASNAPAAGLVEKIRLAGNEKALAMKIGLDTSIQGGGWQTYLTENRNMSVIITQNKDCTIQLKFIGAGVPIYRSTFFETVIHATRPFLLNAQDYPEPAVIV